MPPCQTADPWVSISGSPCRGRVRGLWIGVRDMGSRSEPSAERDVLAGHLVERRHQIIRRDSGSRDYAVVDGLQQSQSVLFGTAGDGSDLQNNQVIRIFEAQERRRVQELASRHDVNDLEEVVRLNAQRAHQSILNRRRHLAETSLVVLSFEDVDLGDGHLYVLSIDMLDSTRFWVGR